MNQDLRDRAEQIVRDALKIQFQRVYEILWEDFGELTGGEIRGTLTAMSNDRVFYLDLDGYLWNPEYWQAKHA